MTADRLLESRLIYGSYPEAVLDQANAASVMAGIYRNYLYKDALEYQGLKNPDLIERLLAALALQIGQEVSYTELSNLLRVDEKTVARYIRLLELAFVVFRLPPLARNLRKEISKSRKIYFWDTGVRNAVINNFNSLTLRNDVGGLWENWLISERLKANEIKGLLPNRFFWRTWSRQEVDYIEESGGRLSGWEIKWPDKPAKAPKAWLSAYAASSWQLINRKNYLDFLSLSAPEKR